MPVSPFTDLMSNIDGSIKDVFGAAAQGMSNWIVPIGWVMLGITLLLWSFMIYQGQSQNIADYVKKLFVGVVILQFAGVMYGTYVSGPLFQLPDELSHALTGSSNSMSTLDALADKLDQLIIGVAQASVDALKEWNIGGAALLLIALILIAFAGALLLLACVFNMIYAKVGLALLLAVGPFFIVCLMWKTTGKWFFSWLNTVLYFSFLSAFSTLIMLMFIGIANKFMMKLAEALSAANGAGASFTENVFSFLTSAMTGQAGATAGAVGSSGANLVGTNFNILSIAFQMVLIFVPLFLVAMEMRTMVSSITGGSGGSFGSGVVNVVSTAWRGGIGRAG